MVIGKLTQTAFGLAKMYKFTSLSDFVLVLYLIRSSPHHLLPQMPSAKFMISAHYCCQFGSKIKKKNYANAEFFVVHLK